MYISTVAIMRVCGWVRSTQRLDGMIISLAAGPRYWWPSTPTPACPARAASCPQAASMSVPRLRRTVALTPSAEQLVPEARAPRLGGVPRTG